jgi:predicted O-methyltransferase YrrM
MPSARIQYLNSLVPEDDAFCKLAKAEALRINKEGISISPFEGNMLGFFIRQQSCKKFVELGTLTGYSGLKILQSLPNDGHLWTLELNEEHARIASTLFDQAGFSGRYTLLVGKAENFLEDLLTHAPFDGVFIDANKAAYPAYLDWSLKAIKTGGLIIADNTLLKGVVPTDDKASPNKITQNLRLFNTKLSNRAIFDSILIPTDEGLSIAIKK